MYQVIDPLKHNHIPYAHLGQHILIEAYYPGWAKHRAVFACTCMENAIPIDCLSQYCQRDNMLISVEQALGQEIWPGTNRQRVTKRYQCSNLFSSQHVNTSQDW